VLVPERACLVLRQHEHNHHFYVHRKCDRKGVVFWIDRNHNRYGIEGHAQIRQRHGEIGTSSFRRGGSASGTPALRVTFFVKAVVMGGTATEEASQTNRLEDEKNGSARAASSEAADQR